MSCVGSTKCQYIYIYLKKGFHQSQHFVSVFQIFVLNNIFLQENFLNNERETIDPKKLRVTLQTLYTGLAGYLRMIK